jgi:hypothetical protein
MRVTWVEKTQHRVVRLRGLDLRLEGSSNPSNVIGCFGYKVQKGK